MGAEAFLLAFDRDPEVAEETSEEGVSAEAALHILNGKRMRSTEAMFRGALLNLAKGRGKGLGD